MFFDNKTRSKKRRQHEGKLKFFPQETDKNSGFCQKQKVLFCYLSSWRRAKPSVFTKLLSKKSKETVDIRQPLLIQFVKNFLQFVQHKAGLLQNWLFQKTFLSKKNASFNFVKFKICSPRFLLLCCGSLTSVAFQKKKFQRQGEVCFSESPQKQVWGIFGKTSRILRRNF